MLEVGAVFLAERVLYLVELLHLREFQLEVGVLGRVDGWEREVLRTLILPLVHELDGFELDALGQAINMDSCIFELLF